MNKSTSRAVLGLLIVAMAWPLHARAQEPVAAAEQLSTAAIIQAFNNVRDEAQVQDAAGTSAVNHWYADGRFSNRWRNTAGSGEVTGRWRAADDQRCVTILSGLPAREGKETCSPVYRRGDRYLSLNPDGSIHGIHTLTPLTPQH